MSEINRNEITPITDHGMYVGALRFVMGQAVGLGRESLGSWYRRPDVVEFYSRTAQEFAYVWNEILEHGQRQDISGI